MSILPYVLDVEENIHLGEYFIVGRRQLPRTIADNSRRWMATEIDDDGKRLKYMLRSVYCLPGIDMLCSRKDTTRDKWSVVMRYTLPSGRLMMANLSRQYNLRTAKTKAEAMRYSPQMLEALRYNGITTDDAAAFKVMVDAKHAAIDSDDAERGRVDAAQPRQYGNIHFIPTLERLARMGLIDATEEGYVYTGSSVPNHAAALHTWLINNLPIRRTHA